MKAFSILILRSLLMAVISAVLPAAAEESEFPIGPDYTNAPETKSQEGVPRGLEYDEVSATYTAAHKDLWVLE